MKRKIIYTGFLILMALSFTACEGMFQDCKFCKNVTYDNGSVISESDEAEYCGTALLQKESTPDLVQGSIVIKVECR